MNLTRTEAGLYVPEPIESGEVALYRGMAARMRGRTERDVEVPTTDDELWDWVKHVLNVEIPRTKCCAKHVPPFEAFAHAYFAKTTMAVWLASRGFGGKSFLLALLSLTEAITLGASVNLLGGSGEQSERVHSYIAGSDPNAWGKFWNAPNAPRGLLLSDPTKREMRLSNGARIRALMASARSVRGPHPQRLRLDEVDEMELSIFDAAMGQTMKSRGVDPQTVCSSTHHNPDGTMTEILRRARTNNWPVFEWCYKENVQPHGWLEPAEVARKRQEVPAAMFEIEYDLQKPSPETRAIDPAACKHLFNRDLGVFAGDEGSMSEVRIVEPVHLRDFYHGTDWARDRDWTIIHSMERRRAGLPDRLAAWARHGRKPWPIMIGAHNKRVEEYGGASAHDVTGIGGVIEDFLEVDSFGFDFSNRRHRTDLLWNYIAAIEQGDQMEYPFIEWAYEEHLFCTNEDLYKPGSGHLPDTLAAGALSWWAREYGNQPYDSEKWGTLK